jgi:hypothetical protein
MTNQHVTVLKEINIWNLKRVTSSPSGLPNQSDLVLLKQERRTTPNAIVRLPAKHNCLPEHTIAHRMVKPKGVSKIIM